MSSSKAIGGQGPRSSFFQRLKAKSKKNAEKQDIDQWVSNVEYWMDNGKITQSMCSFSQLMKYLGSSKEEINEGQIDRLDVVLGHFDKARRETGSLRASLDRHANGNTMVEDGLLSIDEPSFRDRWEKVASARNPGKAAGNSNKLERQVALGKLNQCKDENRFPSYPNFLIASSTRHNRNKIKPVDDALWALKRAPTFEERLLDEIERGEPKTLKEVLSSDVRGEERETLIENLHAACEDYLDNKAKKTNKTEAVEILRDIAGARLGLKDLPSAQYDDRDLPPLERRDSDRSDSEAKLDIMHIYT